MIKIEQGRVYTAKIKLRREEGFIVPSKWEVLDGTLITVEALWQIEERYRLAGEWAMEPRRQDGIPPGWLPSGDLVDLMPIERERETPLEKITNDAFEALAKADVEDEVVTITKGQLASYTEDVADHVISNLAKDSSMTNEERRAFEVVRHNMSDSVASGEDPSPWDEPYPMREENIALLIAFIERTIAKEARP